MTNTAHLAKLLTIKAAAAPDRTASLFTEDVGVTANQTLQSLIGDPDTNPVSWTAQYNSDSGRARVPDMKSPTGGDDIFYNGLTNGSRFLDKNGEWWDIESYTSEDGVMIRKTWYPDVELVTSVQNIRRSIHAWVEPYYQPVPEPPIGVDYGVMQVRVVD